MKKLLIIALWSHLFYPIYGQTNDSFSIQLSEDLEQIYTQEHITGFSVGIVNQDGTLFQKGYGYADKKTNKKYTEHTVQNIASISKTFIGVALLKAQELGELKLDDPVNQYLPFEVINPHFPEIPITIRQLATHTSSIKDPPRYEKSGYVLKDDLGQGKANRNFQAADKMMPQSQFLEKILAKNGAWYKKKNFLKTQPGQTFEYSNIAAGLAALVLENATGQSFKDFTKQYIFNPLKMANSGWAFEDIDFSKHSKLYADKDTELALYQLVNYPDGGLITSSADLGKYLCELISGFKGKGKILTEESFKELFKPQLTSKNNNERNESTYNDEYNMGIFMGMSAKGQMGHTGGDPGVVTHMFFNTETGVGKILIVNTDIEKEGIKEFIDIWNKLIAYEDKLNAKSF